MKVRLLADHFGGHIHAPAGHIVDMADDHAQASIDGGYAEAVPDETPVGKEPPAVRAAHAAARRRTAASKTAGKREKR